MRSDGRTNEHNVYTLDSVRFQQKQTRAREREREAFFSSILFVVFIMATNVV